MSRKRFRSWSPTQVRKAKTFENGAFRKRSSNNRNSKTLAGFLLSRGGGGKHLENRAFRKRWRHDNHVISLTQFSSKTNPKWPSVNWKHLKRLQRQTSLFKLLRRYVNGEWMTKYNGGCVKRATIFSFLNNRSFAGSDHMVGNKLCWDANSVMGLPKQKKVGLDW